MRKVLIWLLCAAVLAVFGCGGGQKAEPEKKESPKTEAADPHAGHDHGDAAMTKAQGDTVTTGSGLKYIDIKAGDGASPQKGQMVQVHYTGWLLSNGTKFDSSKDRKQPFSFQFGMGRVIKGWDEGLATMKVGGSRQLIIPPQLGYGERGAGAVIPPNSWLVFDVELLSVPTQN